MKRPKYDGIRFYSASDLSFGGNYEKTTKLLNELNINKEYQDINEVIELFKAYQLIFADGIKDEYIKDYKKSAKDSLGIVAEFFKKINDENFYFYYYEVCIGYVDDFWKLFDKFKVYEKISNEKFKEFLYKPDTTLYKILEHKQIVYHYDNIIAENMRQSDQSPKIIVSKYLERKPIHSKLECYFPRNLKSAELEDILQNYIDSEHPNIGILQLISTSQSSSECPISDKLRLNAKRKARNFWEEHSGEGVRISYGMRICFRDNDELISYNEEKPREYEITYDLKWIEDNLDYPTLMNNFIYLFEFTDECGRSTFPVARAQLGILERTLGIKGIKEYEMGSGFRIKDVKSSADTREYTSVLNNKGIRIENIIQWFFSEYLVQEFGVENFVFNSPSEGSSLLEKCKNLLSEMDGVLKQFRMYVEDGIIDRELFEMSSNPIVIGALPSVTKNKYAYAKSENIKAEQNLFFSDQCMLSYLPKYGDHFECFFDLLRKHTINIEDYQDYDKPQLQWLNERGALKIEADGTIKVNILRVSILRDLYYHEVICPLYYGENNKLVKTLVESEDLEYENTLFSRPEQDYLNFVLNKSEYSNGMDLRNKYIHSTYPTDEKIQEADYYYLLKIMIMIILKINEEFCLKE